MAKISLSHVTKIMKKLDLCMLTTVDGRGIPDARPMSNNREVEYEGTSYFFTTTDTAMVKHIRKNDHVILSFISDKMFRKLFLSVSGKASLITDRAEMEKHWSKDISLWFKDGLDTKGLVMIQVEASVIKGWENMKEFELDLRRKHARAVA